jgi:hypothetical protein
VRCRSTRHSSGAGGCGSTSASARSSGRCRRFLCRFRSACVTRVAAWSRLRGDVQPRRVLPCST